ncbi:NAD(P)-dependent dehydrogenase, short-chain alcohol dehydrogenase family [Modicisalibacter muralis]|uniref:NAD(P)-dependent dehydrogenase, short-chain alcohol dehydrogenase family n=1 Tax=Modicisalibacter muralis TaxID=119000 RepID=A0A1G9PMA1_9GAMM|nr:SDR family NAD(P)-dependent oxidoreductase [Halomonas muralis]SDL99829.1 NAD(P)-dependent dehydrogenase, short-chain alcohol dehydrogenase family [Halomonas muralis]
MAREFEGKRVLVTGGARGIGAAVARRFLEEGARVAIGARSEASIEAFRQIHPEYEVIAAAGALDSREHCASVVQQAVDGLGGLDVLINCAGVFAEVPFEQVTQAHWDDNYNVNVAGTFFCLQAALPHLEASGGNVVNFGSDAGLIGYAPSSVYSGAKAAVVNMTRALALELAGRLRINCVCPGNVATDMIECAARQSGDADAYLASAHARSPLKRMARPEEVAEAVLYLASSRASFTHGAILSVDGGGVCGF